MSNGGHVTLVVCAAPLAERCAEIAAALIGAGWTTRVVATPSAQDWLASDEISWITGLAPISVQRHPSVAATWPGDDAVVVAPLTFNTLNKWALGLADTYALGVLCEAIALKRRTIAVPFIGERFWGHPALRGSLSVLSSAAVMVDPRGEEFEELGAVPSGAGESVAAAFDPKRLVMALTD